VKENANIRKPDWPESRSKNVVWYPLYPILGYLAKTCTGLSTTNALTLVAWSCAIGAAVVLFAVARRHYYTHVASTVTDERSTWAGYDNASMWALCFLFFGPAAVFLYSNYTESPFILLLGLFLLFIQKRNWWAAAVVAALASACRSQGVLFGPILALVYILRSENPSIIGRIAFAAVLGVISAIGIGCYMIYLGKTFHDPIAFMHAQKYWHVGLGKLQFAYALNPLHAFQNFWDYVYVRPSQGWDPDWPRIWESFSVFFPPFVLILGRKYLSFELLLFGWILWALPYVSNSMGESSREANCLHWMSLGRFIAVVFPLQIIAGGLVNKHKWLGPAMLALSAGLFGLLAYYYGYGAWVG
jgi:Gpi18-like mannosyltransferase